MPGIAASEFSLSLSLSLSLPLLSVALSFIDTRRTPAPSLLPPSLSLSLSLSSYVPAGLAAMPMDYHGLCSRTSKAFACAHTCTRTYVHLYASAIGNSEEKERERERERSCLSTGNKLTSCRKLVNVPWEDRSRERTKTMGGKSAKGREERERTSFARHPEMPVGSDRLEGGGLFVRDFIIRATGFR